MKKINKLDPVEQLMEFIDSAPTAWHAVEYMKKKLLAAGFLQLEEGESWQIKKGGAYFVIRDGATIAAFVAQSHAPAAVHLVGAHTDSPCFKLKPQPCYQQNNMIMLAAEPYGSPLLNSWLNRDLGIAGSVVYSDKDGAVHETLVCLSDDAVVIPQLAIHLDRKINEQGLQLNKQEHLTAIAGLCSDADSAVRYLEKRLCQILPMHKLLASDLFLYPLEAVRRVGIGGELVAGPRLDNLMGTHAAFLAILAAAEGAAGKGKAVDASKASAMPMAVFWNHEEIGSGSASGAASPFFTTVLERICLQYKLGREGFLQLIAKSLCISVDLSHALHPAYQDRHDPRHTLLMGNGIVLKSSAQQRYAGSAPSVGHIVQLCCSLDIALQRLAPRNDLPSGSTIGPIHAAVSGMATVDIGLAQLSMHSCRELAACSDHLALCNLLKAYFC